MRTKLGSVPNWNKYGMHLTNLSNLFISYSYVAKKD